MSEYTLIYLILGGSVGLVISCFLYSLGGRSGKWKRRFIASAILTATINILSVLLNKWNPWMLAVYPILVTGFSLGYGGTDNLAVKIFKRSYCALVICMAGLLLAFLIGGNAWWVFVAHIITAGISVFLGTKNFLPAAVEEFAICLVLNLFLITYPFTG